MVDINNISKVSDQELVRLSLANQDNFLYLVERYKKVLIPYIRRLTNISLEDAEDILQDIFIKVYLNLNDFNGDLKFSSWIYRIAHNQVISNYRKLKARPEAYKVDIEETAALNLVADINIEKKVDLEILKISIFKILNKLDKKYREVLILKFFQEKSYQEISDIIKKPSGTVASIIHKAKYEFKKELSKQNIIL